LCPANSNREVCKRQNPCKIVVFKNKISILLLKRDCIKSNDLDEIQKNEDIYFASMEGLRGVSI
jgi:hypothetical protein